MITTHPAPTPAPAAPPPGRPTRYARRAAALDIYGAMAEVALVALTLAAVFGLGRLFTHPAGFIIPVAFVGISVHVVSWACRRSHLDLARSAGLAALTAIMATTWAVLGSKTTYGIPGPGTLDGARLALDNASAVYRASAAPVPVMAGFTLAAALGAAICAFLADWAGFRMRATTEACLPSFSLFVLSAALAQGHGVVPAGAVWLAALLAFLLARQPALESPATAWFASQSRRGPRTVLGTGLALATVAILAAVIVGPQLPGATVHPVFNWRNRPAGSNRTIGTSPLVDITARLKSLSHQEVFVVTTDRPNYWRLTSLDTFTGSGWALDNEYVGAAGRLPTAGRNPAIADLGPATPLSAQFRLGALASIWLPAAYRPVRITGVNQVSFSSDAGSLITNGSSSDGLAYAVDSAVPSATPAQLAAARPINPTDPTFARYLQLPGSVPTAVRDIAAQVTQAATTPYAKARALQDWLRSPPFRYDLNVKPDGSQDALLNFLTVSRAGFCQQFAASYAVLARSIGLPTRVAVGFTEGNLAADGTYHVTDAEAHAWPEVYFAGIGWTAFEPTPGRGSPDPTAQAVTGAPPAQQTEPTQATVPTATTPTTAPATAGAGSLNHLPTQTTARVSSPAIVARASTVSASVSAIAGGGPTPSGKVTVSDDQGHGCTMTLTGGRGTCSLTEARRGTYHVTATYTGDRAFAGSESAPSTLVVRSPGGSTTSSWLVALAVLIGVPLAWIALLASVSSAARARRRDRARTPGAIVDLAWTEAREALASSGAPPMRWETPAEYTRRAGRLAALPEEARQSLALVARAVEVADYAPTEPSSRAADDSVQAAGRVKAALRSDFTWWDWTRTLADPRPVLGLVFSRRA